jgi:hypothetical protein
MIHDPYLVIYVQHRTPDDLWQRTPMLSANSWAHDQQVTHVNVDLTLML